MSQYISRSICKWLVCHVHVIISVHVGDSSGINPLVCDESGWICVDSYIMECLLLKQK